MEKILINNFGGIKKLSISLKRVNVFIGPQATGKSLTAKIIYFFKSISNEFVKSQNYDLTYQQFKDKIIESFKELFPEDTWTDNFNLKYINGRYNIVINKNKVIKITFSKEINYLFREIKNSTQHLDKSIGNEVINVFDKSGLIRSHFNRITRQEKIDFEFNNFFIPAGRSFYSNFDAAFLSTLNSKQNLLDPFLVEFGSIYIQLKKFFNDYVVKRNTSLTQLFNFDLLYDILNSEYKNENDIDFLIHKDKRKIKLNNSSSGQQEGLPLLITLVGITIFKFKNPEIVLYIEEPEAHLYPTSQKKIVEFITYCANHSINIKQIIITTHSPYVLTTFNNILLASKKYSQIDNSGKEKLDKIIQKKFHIKNNDFTAYAFDEGSATNIFDNKTQLIDAFALDSVSNIIVEEFDSILDV